MAREPVDPRIARVDYDVIADEFLVYFGGNPSTRSAIR